MSLHRELLGQFIQLQTFLVLCLNLLVHVLFRLLGLPKLLHGRVSLKFTKKKMFLFSEKANLSWKVGKEQKRIFRF